MADAERHLPIERPDYKPLRKALVALRREFRRCASKYPPLFHERFEAWSPDGPVVLSANSWQAFTTAVESEGNDDSLVTWDGPHDDDFFGRFLGDPRGLEEFCLLAESTVLALAEFDPIYAERGYSAWLALLHDYAFRQASPLLRSDLIFWGHDRVASFDEFDQFVGEWSGPIGEDGEFALRPLVWTLAHSVFVSSVVAIDAILTPENVLYVGTPLNSDTIVERLSSQKGDVSSPTVDGALPTAEVNLPKSPEGHRGVQTVVEREMGCVLEKVGKQWKIQFRLDGIFETGYVPDEIGIRCYAALLSKPNKWLSGKELIAVAAPGVTSSRSAISEEESLDTADAFDGHAKWYAHVDGMSDNERKEAIEKTRELYQEAHAPGDLQRSEEIESLLKYLLEADRKHGRVPDDSPLLVERKRNRGRVWNALSRCLQDILGDKMHRFAEYLRIKELIKAKDYGYVYQPEYGPKVEWEVRW